MFYDDSMIENAHLKVPPLRPGLTLGVALLAALFAVGSFGCDDDGPSPIDAGTQQDAAIDSCDPQDIDAIDEGEEEIVEPPTLLDGEACAADTDCVSGRCLTEAEGFPGGYCTFFDCVERADCAGVTTGCLRGQFNGNLCVELCAGDDSCREGYECQSTGIDSDSGGYCYPAFVSENLEYRCDSELIAEGDVISSYFDDMDRHRLTFDISDEATSFAVVAYNRYDEILADTLESPSGETLNLLGDYGFFMRTGLILENISPILFPAGPDWLPWIEPGTYTLDVGTTGDEVCYFVLENHGLGTKINLNFYFVGVRGLNAQSADRDPDFQQMLASFSDTMALAEIEVDGLRYFDVTGDVEDAFSRIYTEAQVYELMRLSRASGQTREDLLSRQRLLCEGLLGRHVQRVGRGAGHPGCDGNPRPRRNGLDLQRSKSRKRKRQPHGRASARPRAWALSRPGPHDRARLRIRLAGRHARM